MRSVVVVKHVPWPANSGEKLRSLGLIEALRDHGPVVVCGFAGPAEDPDGLRRLRVEVRAVPVARPFGTLATGLVRTRSLSGARFWSPALRRAVEESAQGADLLMAGHVQLAVGYKARGAARYVVDMQNIESELMTRQAARAGLAKGAVLRAEAWLLRRLERGVDADLVTTCTQRDRDTYASLGGRTSTVVVPNAWPTTSPLPPASGPVASFVALQSWGPNVEASVWLARQVWPRVRAQLPDARLELVGRDPAPQVMNLATDDIVVTGTVPDLVPAYTRSRVALAPLLAGGGSRMKILEALAYGRPVVATTIGAEGLEDLVGRGLVLADDPEDMAQAIVAMLGSAEMSERWGRAGAEAVARDHGWAAATDGLFRELASTAGAAR